MDVRTTYTFTDWTALAGCWDRAGLVRVPPLSEHDRLSLASLRFDYHRKVDLAADEVFKNVVAILEAMLASQRTGADVREIYPTGALV